jgi:hypothetical protein
LTAFAALAIQQAVNGQPDVGDQGEFNEGESQEYVVERRGGCSFGCGEFVGDGGGPGAGAR